MALHSDDPHHPILIQREPAVAAPDYLTGTRAALEAAGQDVSLWRPTSIACAALVTGGLYRQCRTESEAQALAWQLDDCASLYATYLHPHTCRPGRIVWVRVR